MMKNEKNEIPSMINDARACAESDALIAYLYCEASGAEAQAFERHLTACSTCREELASFGGVRLAVGE